MRFVGDIRRMLALGLARGKVLGGVGEVWGLVEEG